MNRAMTVCTSFILFLSSFVVAAEPTDAAARLSRGETFARQGNHDKAIEEFTAAIRAEPDNARAYIRRGRSYAKNGDFDKAIADLSVAIRLDPKDACAYADRAWYLSQNNCQNKALVDFVEAINLEWNTRVEIKRDEAIENCTEALRLDPDDVAAYRKRGRKYFAKHDYGKAIEDFTQVVRLEPKAASSYLLRGVSYMENRKFSEAIEDFTQAIRLDSESILAYFARGIICAKMDKCDKAIEDFTYVLSVEPNIVWCYIYRGDSYVQKGCREQAINDYSEAVRLAPRDVSAYLSRAAMHAENGDLDKAIADMTQVIRMAPANTFALRRRGTWLAKKGDHDLAIEDFTEAVRLDPTDSSALVGRAFSYKKKGRRDEAEKDFAAAFRIDFNDERPGAAHGAEAVKHRFVEQAVRFDVKPAGVKPIRQPVDSFMPDVLNVKNEMWKSDLNLGDAGGAIKLPPLLAVSPPNVEEATTACMNRAASHAKRGEHDKAIQAYTEAVSADRSNSRAYKCRGESFEKLGNWYGALTDYAEAVRLDQPETQESARRNLDRVTKRVRKKWASVEVEILSVEMDESPKKVVTERKRPALVELKTEKTVDVTPVVQHSMAVCETWIADDEIKEKMFAKWPEIETGLKRKIDKLTNRPNRSETERKRAVASKSTDFALGRKVQEEYHRTGRVRVKIGGDEVEVPFEFREEADLLAERAE